MKLCADVAGKSKAGACPTKGSRKMERKNKRRKGRRDETKK
jgi:hypothetical protein